MKTISLEQHSIAPSKIVCVGRNYVEHIEELGNDRPEQMVLFCKPNSALSERLQSVQGEPLHYEGELCFMVEKGQFAAVGLGLDLTKRHLQSQLKAKGLPWERAKAFDGSAVLSPFVRIDPRPQNLHFEWRINGQQVQQGNLDMMIYKPDQILSEIQSFMTLNEGDVVMTGTPKGVGVIRAEDHFQAVLKQGDAVLLEAQWFAEA